MPKRHLRRLSKMITKDVIRELKSSRTHEFSRSLPGRKKVYVWPPDLKRDEDQDESVADFKVRLNVLAMKADGMFSIDGLAGDEDGEPCIWITLSWSRDPTSYRALYHELVGVIRHELEHLSTISPFMMMGPDQADLYGEELPVSGKILHIINRRRRLFGVKDHPRALWASEELARAARATSDMSDYIMSYDEIDPFCRGFYMQACSSRRPYDEVVSDYLDFFRKDGQITEQGARIAHEWLILWAKDIFPKIKLSLKAPP